MYVWMDAGGLLHRDFSLSFCSRLNALRVCSQQFFYLGTRKVLFFVECECLASDLLKDLKSSWAAWSQMPLNRVVVTRPKVYRLASLGERLKEEVEHNASESNSLTENEVYGLNPFRITNSWTQRASTVENVNFDISIFPKCLCHVNPYVTSMHLVSSGNTSVSQFPLPGH